MFQEIDTWIKDCLENHSECPRSADTLLPTRVLDVGVDGDGSSEDVRLHVSSTGECGRYIALSYCWGTCTQTRTVKDNLSDHIQSITVANLPQTIQDAVRVTRELKIRYLWVDALCIVQDSLDDDWPREAGRMPEIYKNAVVTISAAAATDSSQGFLQHRQSVLMSQMQACRLPVYKFGSENGEGEEEDATDAENIGEVFVTQDSELGYNIKDFDEENINTRAWTLQEMWLSPRLISFGSGLPQWICLKHERTYGIDEITPRYSWDKEHQVRRQIFTEADDNAIVVRNEQNQPDSTDYLRQWTSLSINYSRRNLTVKTDKMAAIAGIAKEFGKLLNDEYVAGLWKSSLPESLLWYHENHEETTSHMKRRKRDKILAFFSSSKSKALNSRSAVPEPYVAPSWSPFANNGPAHMSLPTVGEFKTLCTINSLQVQPANDIAPFLAIRQGHDWLNITAPMTQMSYGEIVSYFVVVTDGGPHMYWDWIVPDGGAANECLGPAAKLQMQHPQINPQVLIESKLTSMLSAEQPLVQENPERPTPPPCLIPDRWPDPMNQGIKRTRGITIPDVDFWLLEIGHSNVPTGLVLRRLEGSNFKRLGMFGMGRNQNPNWKWRNGLEIEGPRRWDWDSRLQMRTCQIN